MTKIKKIIDTILGALALITFFVIFGTCFSVLAYNPECRDAHYNEDVAAIMTYCR